MTPQRINDQDLELHARNAEYRISVDGGSLVDRAWLDLRDGREQLKTLRTYGEAKFAAENDQAARIERLERRNANLIANCNTHNEHLKMAIEGLELVADQNDSLYAKQVAQTYLDRIKGIS